MAGQCRPPAPAGLIRRPGPADPDRTPLRSPPSPGCAELRPPGLAITLPPTIREHRGLRNDGSGPEQDPRRGNKTSSPQATSPSPHRPGAGPGRAPRTGQPGPESAGVRQGPHRQGRRRGPGQVPVVPGQQAPARWRPAPPAWATLSGALMAWGAVAVVIVVIVVVVVKVTGGSSSGTSDSPCRSPRLRPRW